MPQTPVEELEGTYVPAAGRQPCDFLIVGEAPGIEEAARGRPFVGRAGREQDAYLSRHSDGTIHSRQARLANVYPIFREGNPDPSPSEIREWSEILEQEILNTNPSFILAVGRFATRWFLGPVDLDSVHGLPHRAGAFDPSLARRGNGAVIVPAIHPAAGFYDSDIRALIDWDYGQAVRWLKAIRRGNIVPIHEDEYEGSEDYQDVSGKELARRLRDEMGRRGVSLESGDARSPRTYPKTPGTKGIQAGAVLGLDTEGTPDDPWSIQISIEPGTGLVLRRSRPDFSEGMAAIQAAVDAGVTVVIHNALYDIPMSRVMGLELRDARIWDSMYAAYLLRLEPQALKPLTWRWAGMRMASYTETVGDVGVDKQVDYLGEILGREWPKPEERLEIGNDGTAKIRKPQPVERRAEAILVDLYSGKTTGDGDPVDPYARWKMVDKELRSMVEAELGPMPVGTLGDIDLDAAVYYSCRDADAVVRIKPRLEVELADRGLTELMEHGMEVLPIFEEMQETGMPASRRYFVDLHTELTVEMDRLQSRISHRYWEGQPFNPASHKQVGELMQKRRIQGVKKTKTGAMSTGRKSIEHLRTRDPAIADVIEWREHQKLRDSFCQPVIERIPIDGPDLYPIRCQIKTTRVHTRRLAAADPNLLGIPTRTELGKKIRAGYVCPPGEVFIGADLSQIEMRYMAHLSGDDLLCRAFREGRDIHSETAATIFGIRVEDVDGLAHRYPAKRVAFGVITSITGHGLADQLRLAGCGDGWDEEACDDLIEEWFKLYRGVKDFMNACKAEVRKNGYVRDEWGMTRYLPGVWSNDGRAVAEAERASSSHKISGGAQGMLQNSMRFLNRELRPLRRDGVNIRWAIQVHDEVIFIVPEEWAEVVETMTIEALTEHHGVNMRVPVEASSSIARSWGDLK